MKSNPTQPLWVLSSAGALALAIASISNVAQAGCTDTGFCGRIFYLGKTSDKKQAVFLSATKTPGKYDVSTTEAFAPNGGGDKLIDTWSRNRPGLRLTVSDYPQDWGGTHILYSYATDSTPLNERRFVASVNQTPDGIVFPPNFKPPVIKPPQPPVTGITPELPMGIKPPIGTLPPQPPVTGITPELPIGVKPPIAVIPPKPPVTGITPELPMGTKPPIGTLPPAPPVTGITPELPIGVKPPIGTLPPETGGELVAQTNLKPNSSDWRSRTLRTTTRCQSGNTIRHDAIDQLLGYVATSQAEKQSKSITPYRWQGIQSR